MSKCLIDYLSFSGSPQLLERCKQMAKARFHYQYPQRVDHPTPMDERTQNEFLRDNIASTKHKERVKISLAALFCSSSR